MYKVFKIYNLNRHTLRSKRDQDYEIISQGREILIKESNLILRTKQKNYPGDMSLILKLWLSIKINVLYQENEDEYISDF